jgi:hypothetical protein
VEARFCRHAREWHCSWAAARAETERKAEAANNGRTATAANIPTICAMMNAGTPAGAMSAKVSESARAIVTAGFANDLEG